GPLIFGNMETSTLLILERVGWWAHIMMLFAFLNYLPFSKHLHIIWAFPNTFFANLKPMGQFSNMESVTTEVKLMLDPTADPFAVPAPVEGAVTERFGAKDINDLPWVNILSAYSCTECGRCSEACPASTTGKLLSPRKIMMDVRDRAD